MRTTLFVAVGLTAGALVLATAALSAHTSERSTPTVHGSSYGRMRPNGTVVR